MLQSTLITLAVALGTSALPVRRQQDAATTQNLLVLNFANVLEQLETQFYSQALSQFQDSDFTNAGFTNANVAQEQLTSIQSDEATHASTLQSVITSLGGTPISGCQFNFSSILTDVSTMAAAARLIENVGVGAYLGAAHLLSDPSLLTAAASIATVESRHQSILNVLSGTGSAIPQAFDMPLAPPQVLAIAGGFISGCNPGITANQPLTVSNGAGAQAGTQLQLSSPAIQNNDFSNLFCQLMVGGASFSMSQNLTSDGQGCIIPPNTNGPVAVYVTNSSQPLDNNVVDQFLGNQVAGPAIIFIDSEPEVLGQLARNTGNTTISSTAAISPAEASSIAASGGAAPTDASSSTDAASASATDAATATGTDAASSATATDAATATGSDAATATGSDAVSATGSDAASATGTASIASASGNSTLPAANVAGAALAAGNDTVSLVPPGNLTGVTATPTTVTGTGNSLNAVKLGGVNLYTGPSANGLFTIIGWQNVPTANLS